MVCSRKSPWLYDGVAMDTPGGLVSRGLRWYRPGTCIGRARSGKSSLPMTTFSPSRVLTWCRSQYFHGSRGSSMARMRATSECIRATSRRMQWACSTISASRFSISWRTVGASSPNGGNGDWLIR